MKIEKLREMSPEELKLKLAEFQDGLFKLKIKVQTKQVENTAQLSGLRKDIAKIKTLLRALELKTTTPAAAGVKK